MYADAGGICTDIFAGIYAPPERLTVDRWAERHRTHATEGIKGEATGAWDCTVTPCLIGPLRAYTDPEPRVIAVQKSTQCGATDGLIYNCTLYDADRGRSQMLVLPTAKKGQENNQQRLAPAFKATPVLAKYFDPKHSLTADKLRLTNGVIIEFAYTGSSDSLRGTPCGFPKCDEIDTFDCSKENPIENVASRTRSFADSKTILTSTPMGEDTGITRQFDTADVQHAYQCPCPRCGQFFELWDFALLGWIGGVDTDPVMAAANCWLTCPHCQHKIREECKLWMVQHGLWITQHETIESDGSITATLDPVLKTLTPGSPKLCSLTADFFRDASEQPDPVARNQGMTEDEAGDLRNTLGITVTGPRSHGPVWGFRFNTIASPIAKAGWGGLVYGFVKAKGRPDATWWRDNLGQSPTQTAKTIEAANLMQLCKGREIGGHEHGQCPSWTTACLGAVDIQKDCIKVMVWAFGPLMRKMALVLTRIIPRDEDLQLAEPHLEDAILDLAIREGLPIQSETIGMGGFQTRRAWPAFFVDTGAGEWTDQSYAFVHRLETKGCRVFCCKGIENKFHDARPFRVSDLRYQKTINNEKISDHTPSQLVLVNTAFFKSQLATRTRPLAKEDLDLDGVMYHPLQLPGESGWLDDEGRPMAGRVIREMTAEHLIMIGAGSGRSGKDGLGQPRQVWRKVTSDRTNDFTDTSVYILCNAMFHGIHELDIEIPVESPPSGGEIEHSSDVVRHLPRPTN